MIPKKADAILSLVPNFKGVVRDDDSPVEWHSPASPAVSDAQIETRLAQLIAGHSIEQVKEIRRRSLDKFVKNSPGISRIYSENYFAAMELQAARPSTLMVCGVTVEAYLTALGLSLGMTAAQFAAYIINENRGTVGLAIKGNEIEKEYVRLVYLAMPAMTTAQAAQAVTDYEAFCAARAP